MAKYTIQLENLDSGYADGHLDIHDISLPDGFLDAGIILPSMSTRSWNSFARWIDPFESPNILNLEQLVQLYQMSNPPIEWKPS